MTYLVQTSRRSFLRASAAMSLIGTGALRAQPAGSTHLVVPVPAGGGMDVTARIIAESLRKDLGPVLVENKPGAALRLAVEQVARAMPDGKKLLFSPASPFTLYPYIYDQLSYDARADFVPVASVVSFEFALAVPGDSAIHSLDDYIGAVQRKPEESGMYAVPAAGAAPHFAGSQFSRIAGLRMTHVPYKGSAPAMQDVVGGHVPAIFNLVGEFLPYLGDGRVRLLATTGSSRSAFTPDVPTFKELGYDGMVLNEWFGIFAPAQTPVAVVERVSSLVDAALREPEVTSRISSMGYTPFYLAAGAAALRLRNDMELWRPIVEASGFKIE